MTRATSNTRGHDLAQRFYRGLAQAQRAPRSGSRQLPIVTGLTHSCLFHRPIENVLADVGELLITSRRVFLHGNSPVLEVENGIEKKLVTLATAYKVASSASALLANLFICAHGGNENSPPSQFPPPPGLAGLLFCNEPLADRLPKIEQYALRPVFDQNFKFRGPGWHADVGILVHGPDVEPIPFQFSTSANTVRDRLPPRLKELLQDFCFKAECDLVNAIGVLLTGLLMSQFVSNGKAVPLLDGNQPGIGKTLLARVTGIVLDGKEPKAIHFTTDDEELSKRACATLRENPTSVLLFDNAKVKGGGEITSSPLKKCSFGTSVAGTRFRRGASRRSA